MSNCWCVRAMWDFNWMRRNASSADARRKSLSHAVTLVFEHGAAVVLCRQLEMGGSKNK